MEIPQNIQDQLKCSECAELLSCGPVYLLHETGGVICGRCHQQPEETDSTRDNKRSRIVPYEAIAALLAFPCPFASRGCPEKLKFSTGQSLHELNCKFRPFICPIAARGSCDWIGPWPKLKEHCAEKHPQNILTNLGQVPRPDLTTSNLQSYIISAFHFLFLFQTKVCVASGNLFHSLRMFGDSKFLDRFRFTLEIEGNDVKVIKSGSVLRAGILTIQEPTSICTSINNLLGILDGEYNELEFTIRIQALFKFCVNCFKHIEDDCDSKFCYECEKLLVKCDLYCNGCTFVDVNDCEKHHMIFCPFNTFCFYCEEDISCKLIEHLEESSSSHKTMKSDISSIVRVTLNHEFVLLSTNNIGHVICEYSFFNSYFTLNLCTSLPSYELKYFKCSIKVIDPQTRHTQMFTPQINYEKYAWNDWNIKVEKNNFPSLANIGVDIQINIMNI